MLWGPLVCPVGWDFRIKKNFYMEIIYESRLDAATFLVFK